MSTTSLLRLLATAALCAATVAPPARAVPVVLQPGFNIAPFAGLAAGGQPLQSPKYSVIDAPGGAFGGGMYVSELGGGVVSVAPNGAIAPFAGPFPSGPIGMDIDGPIANIAGNTAGLYGGPNTMYVNGVNQPVISTVGPGGGLPVLFPTNSNAQPGHAQLQFDRTPGQAFNGLMYISDWGGDATDGILSVNPVGNVGVFAAMPNTDPRYFTIDTSGGATGYAGNMYVSQFATGAIVPVAPGGAQGPALAVLAQGIEGIAFALGDAFFGNQLYVGNVITGTIDIVTAAGAVVPFVGGLPGAAYLQFVTAGPYAIGGLPTLYVDDGINSIWAITPQVVPLPGTVLLLGLGMGLLAFLRRSAGA